MARAPYRIADGQAVLLDLVRLAATLAVFVGHATRPAEFFDEGLSPIGRATIPIFLMLSGYLTAAAMTKGGRFHKKVLRRYLGLWFVVIPAIILLLAADLWLVAQQSPILHNDKFQCDPLWNEVLNQRVAGYPFGCDYGVLRFLREAFEALTFSGEYWRLNTVSQGLWANQAYWTVDYIMSYVVATAALYLLAGWQRFLALLLIAGLSGPTVILLSPLWFAGILALEIHRRCSEAHALETAGRAAEAPSWPRWLRRYAVLIGLVGLALTVFIELRGIGENLYQESKSWAGYELRQHLGMAKRFAWQWLLVPGLFAMLLSLKYILRWQPSARMVSTMRSAARHTLPIYMFHFSALYVAHSLIPDYQPSWRAADPYIMMALALGGTLALSWAAYRYLKPAADRLIARIL